MIVIFIRIGGESGFGHGWIISDPATTGNPHATGN